jgi:hypothetical protein
VLQRGERSDCGRGGCVEWQQVGLVRSATFPACIKCLCVIMLTELWVGGVYSGVARLLDSRDEQYQWPTVTEFMNCKKIEVIH